MVTLTIQMDWFGQSHNNKNYKFANKIFTQMNVKGTLGHLRIHCKFSSSMTAIPVFVLSTKMLCKQKQKDWCVQSDTIRQHTYLAQQKSPTL